MSRQRLLHVWLSWPERCDSWLRENGVPEWGTKFTQIESEGMNVGLELARLFMEQSVDKQADRVPDSALECDGKAAMKTKETKTAVLETKCRRSGMGTAPHPTGRIPAGFFPSGEGVGDQH